MSQQEYDRLKALAEANQALRSMEEIDWSDMNELSIPLELLPEEQKASELPPPPGIPQSAIEDRRKAETISPLILKLNQFTQLMTGSSPEAKPKVPEQKIEETPVSRRVTQSMVTSKPTGVRDIFDGSQSARQPTDRKITREWTNSNKKKGGLIRSHSAIDISPGSNGTSKLIISPVARAASSLHKAFKMHKLGSIGSKPLTSQAFKATVEPILRELAKTSQISQADLLTKMQTIEGQLDDLRDHQEALQKEIHTTNAVLEQLIAEVKKPLDVVATMMHHQAEATVQYYNTLEEAQIGMIDALGKGIERITSEMKSLKVHIGQFDAHLADMSKKPIEQYRSAYEPVPIQGPTIKAAEEPTAILTAPVLVTTKTVFADKLAALRAVSNLKSRQIFEQIPGLTEAEATGNYDLAIQLLDEHMKKL
nr:MAG: hypothetical protein [Usmuvirus newyorkense]